jgi:hypothetical protein
LRSFGNAQVIAMANAALCLRVKIPLTKNNFQKWQRSLKIICKTKIVSYFCIPNHEGNEVLLKKPL